MERLGYKDGTNPNIRDHKFFERINWSRLEERKMTPPFKPSVVSDFPVLPTNCLKKLGDLFLKIKKENNAETFV